jgi:hypothetical protein
LAPGSGGREATDNIPFEMPWPENAAPATAVLVRSVRQDGRLHQGYIPASARMEKIVGTTVVPRNVTHSPRSKALRHG